MGYGEDFKKFADNQKKCGSCIYFDIENENLQIDKSYKGKIAICSENHSGRYKVGHNSICCEFYKSNSKLN